MLFVHALVLRCVVPYLLFPLSAACREPISRTFGFVCAALRYTVLCAGSIAESEQQTMGKDDDDDDDAKQSLIIYYIHIY